MSDPHNHRAFDRIRVDLIEADVDMAFGLVDDALEESRDGNVAYARAALNDAEKVLTDIEAGLGNIGPANSAPFGPLVDELRRSVIAARAECG